MAQVREPIALIKSGGCVSALSRGFKIDLIKAENVSRERICVIHLNHYRK